MSGPRPPRARASRRRPPAAPPPRPAQPIPGTRSPQESSAARSTSCATRAQRTGARARPNALTSGAMPVRRLAAVALACAPALLLTASATAATPTLRAGAGRADITPPTGYFMMGWVRSDAKTIGQHTRLFARVIVLQRGGRKVALVAEDLNGIPGGMLKAAADLDRDRGR